MDLFFEDASPITAAEQQVCDGGATLLSLLGEVMSYQAAREAVAHHFQQQLCDYNSVRRREARAVEQLREEQEEELASVLSMGSKGDGTVLVSSRLMEPVFARHNDEVEAAVALMQANLAKERRRCCGDLELFLRTVCSDLRERAVPSLISTLPSTAHWLEAALSFHCLRVPNPRREQLFGARSRDPSVGPIVLQVGGGQVDIAGMLVRNLSLGDVITHLQRLGQHRLSMLVAMDDAAEHADAMWAACDDELVLTDKHRTTSFDLGGVQVKVSVTTCIAGGTIAVSVPPVAHSGMRPFVAALLNFASISGVDHITLLADPNPTITLQCLVDCLSEMLINMTAQRPMNPWSTNLPTLLAGAPDNAPTNALAKGRVPFNLGVGVTLLLSGKGDPAQIQSVCQAAFPDGFELF